MGIRALVHSTEGEHHSWPPLTTTLTQLHKHGACAEGYTKLVRALQGKPSTTEDGERETHIRFKHEAEIPLEFILDSNGLDDALWALRASNCSERDARLLIVAFALEVGHLMPEASRAALDVAEQFANGLATSYELAEARSAAYTAAADEEARQRQVELFRQLCRGAAPWQSEHFADCVYINVPCDPS